MHILSELRNPQFDPPDRQRALRALQTSRLLKESNTSRPWSVIKTMIDKVVAEQYQPTPSGSRYNSPSSSATPMSGTVPSRQVPIYTETLPPFPYQPTSDPYALQMQPSASQQQQQQQMVPSEAQFNWDDITLNNSLGNLVGDVPESSSEMPQFDWVSLRLSSTINALMLTVIGLLG